MKVRRARRYPLRIKAQVRAVGSSRLGVPVETWARDLSGAGLFLELDQPFQVGMQMRLTLQLPSGLTPTPVTIRCVSRVVRVASEQGRSVGVGAVIEKYQFVRELEEAATPA